MPQRKKIKVFYIFGSPRSPLLKKGNFHYLHNTALYGLGELHKWHIKTEFSDYAFTKGIKQYGALMINMLLNRLKVIPFNFNQGLLLLKRINSADLVFTTSDSCGLPILALKKWKLVKPPIIFTSIGLPEKIQNLANSKISIKRYQQLLQLSARIITYSLAEKKQLINILKISEERFAPILTPGVDTEIFSPSNTDPQDNFIFSIGSDPQRDYKTLFEVFKEIKLPLKVATFPKNLEGLIIPNNVAVEYGIPYLDTKKYFESSRFAILPVKENSYSGAFMSAFQAMAMEKAVILSNVSALEGYHFEHKNNCWLVPPGDKDAICEAIEKLWNDPELCRRIGKEARKTVLKHYTYDRYCEQLANIFWEVYLQENNQRT